MTLPRVLAVAAAAVALVATGLGGVALRDGSDAGGTASFVAGAVIGLYAVVLGLLVTRRHPANLVGAVLAWTGAFLILSSASEMYTLTVAGADKLAAFSEGSWMWLYVPVALLALLFPDGRLPSPRWRMVAAGLLTVPVAFTVLVAMSPGPYPAPYDDVPRPLGTHQWAAPLAIAMLPLFLGLLVASAVSLFRRRRTADAVGRDRLKWLVVAGLTVPATLLLCWTSYLLLGDADLVVVGLAAMYVGIPTATAIAMLRHDLYDVDRVLSGTITYGLVSAALLTVLTVATFVSGLVVPGDSTIAAAAATAICAVLLSPLRNRLQRKVDEKLYPVRRGTLAAIEDLRRRAHAGTARPEELEPVLRAAMADPDLRVGYRMPGGTAMVDAAGNDRRTGAGATPVLIGDDEIGAITFSRGCPAPLAREIADASALLVEVVRLRLELRAALDAADAGRARLLRVSYAERRKLERDLHDGAQQRLVSLGMSLRLAQRHLDQRHLDQRHLDQKQVGQRDVDGAVDVDGLLDTTVAELATAVAELRQVAHGLRPSSLDDGLGPALSNMTSKVPIPVELDIQANGSLPDELTTTAYYVASEAVANTLKHAAARTVVLKVAQTDGQLRVRVTDDGLGGARVATGSGLAGLSDRVAALGGTFRVLSPPGGGTTVEAVLPCGS
ncbi:MAG: ATP-binding protein [Kribbellaceae bacterium]